MVHSSLVAIVPGLQESLNIVQAISFAIKLTFPAYYCVVETMQTPCFHAHPSWFSDYLGDFPIM